MKINMKINKHTYDKLLQYFCLVKYIAKLLFELSLA